MQTPLTRPWADGLRAIGEVEILHLRDGLVMSHQVQRNLIVLTGIQWMTGALSGDTASPETMKYIAIGIGTDAAASGDTTLGTERGTRGTGTQSRVNTTVTNDTYQAVATVSITDTWAITEAGLFSADTNGTLFARQTFAAINGVNGDTLQVTWKIAQA